MVHSKVLNISRFLSFYYSPIHHKSMIFYDTWWFLDPPLYPPCWLSSYYRPTPTSIIFLIHPYNYRSIPLTHLDDFFDQPLQQLWWIYGSTPINHIHSMMNSSIHPCTHLDYLLEVVVLLLPAVQGHELCLVVIPHPGHPLLTDGAVVTLTDVFMVHHPWIDKDIIKSKS